MESKMPLIRGLLIKGGEPLPEGLEDGLEDAGVAVVTIADLDDTQLDALVGMAEAAAGDGSLDAALANAGEAGAGGAYGVDDADTALDPGGPPPPEVEGEETPAEEAAETPEEQAAEEAAGAEIHSTSDYIAMAEATAEEVESLVKEVEDAAKEAEDPSLVEDFVVQAKELATTCADVADEAKKASKEDDIQAAAAAAAQCDEARETIKGLLAQVQQTAAAPPPDEEAEEPAAAKGGKKGKGSADATPPPKAAPSEAPLATWATMAAKGCKF